MKKIKSKIKTTFFLVFTSCYFYIPSAFSDTLTLWPTIQGSKVVSCYGGDACNITAFLEILGISYSYVNSITELNDKARPVRAWKLACTVWSGGGGQSHHECSWRPLSAVANPEKCTIQPGKLILLAGSDCSLKSNAYTTSAGNFDLRQCILCGISLSGTDLLKDLLTPFGMINAEATYQNMVPRFCNTVIPPGMNSGYPSPRARKDKARIMILQAPASSLMLRERRRWRFRKSV